MKKIFFVIAVLTFTLILGQAVFAIGMITEPIIVNDMLRGGEISETVTVFNPESAEVIYKLGTDGQIKGWAEFFEVGKPNTAVSQVNVPPKSYYDVIAKIKVPDGTPNGEYIGEIFVIQAPKEKPKEGESSVSVSQMISREVKIGVTDKEIISLKTTLIPEAYDINKGESLRIKIIYENLGNIAVKPDLQLKIVTIEGGKTVFNAIFPYPDDQEAVKPGEIKTMPIFEWISAGQENGKYWAETKTLINNKMVGEQKFRFGIGVAAGLLSDSSDNFSESKLLAAVAFVGGGNLTFGWMVIGISLLVLAGIASFVTRKFAFSKVRPEILQEVPEVKKTKRANGSKTK